MRCVLQLWWRRSSRSCSDSWLSVTLSGEALSLYSKAIRTHGPFLPAFDLLIKGFVPCYYLLFMVLKMAVPILHTTASASSSQNCHKQAWEMLQSGGSDNNLNHLVKNYITEMPINHSFPLMNEMLFKVPLLWCFKGFFMLSRRSIAIDLHPTKVKKHYFFS